MKIKSQDLEKIFIIAGLIAAAILLTWYFHTVLEQGTLFTHFFYIPSILAAYWWRKKGVLVAVVLVIVLLASDLAAQNLRLFTDDVVRAFPLIIIPLIVAYLREEGLRYESALKQVNEKLAKENEARKRAEEFVFQANRKLRLLSKITRHDILNRLMVLEGTLRMQAGKCPDEECRRNAEKMSEMLRSIQNDMEFTRDYEEIGVRGPSWQSVRAAFEQAALKLGLGNVEMVNRVNGVEVFADHMLVKVFYNLLDDSLKHGNGVRRVSLRAEKDKEDLLLIYEDDGVGIPTDMKERIFELGLSPKSDRGLFLAREILSVTGISIKESGKYGQGARFEIRVPKDKYRGA
ncbi:MAG: sensor histidine kinase [Methanomassiliicoccales archaeon]